MFYKHVLEDKIIVTHDTSFSSVQMFNQAKRFGVNMYKVTAALIVSLLFVGCATVPMASKDDSAKFKSFNPPSEGNAGIYIYRGMGPGTALKKDIWIDEKCIGESAPNVFFYQEVLGNKDHKISTESEFSPNDLLVKTEAGKNYFVEQYIKMGVFVGGANLQLVSDEVGKTAISKLEMAQTGKCSK